MPDATASQRKQAVAGRSVQEFVGDNAPIADVAHALHDDSKVMQRKQTRCDMRKREAKRLSVLRVIRGLG